MREAIQYIKKLHGSLIEEKVKEEQEEEEEEEIEDNKGDLHQHFSIEISDGMFCFAISPFKLLLFMFTFTLERFLIMSVRR